MIVRGVDAEPGEEVSAYAARLVLVAWMLGEVHGMFNGREFIAKRGMTRDDVMRDFLAKYRESYFGGDR